MHILFCQHFWAELSHLFWTFLSGTFFQVGGGGMHVHPVDSPFSALRKLFQLKFCKCHKRAMKIYPRFYGGNAVLKAMFQEFNAIVKRKDIEIIEVQCTVERKQGMRNVASKRVLTKIESTSILLKQPLNSHQIQKLKKLSIPVDSPLSPSRKLL